MLMLLACSGGASTPAPPTSKPAASPAATPVDITPGYDPQAILDDRRESYRSPGALAAIAVGGDRQTLVSGTADTAGTPLQPTDRFRIASITKPIVAALVLDQVAQGRLSLDDVVGDLLPGVVRPKPPVTIRQLLDHTSGIFDEGNEGDPIADIDRLEDPQIQREARDLIRRYQEGEHVIAPARVIVALAETHKRYASPGVTYHYSNTNYQLAAMILEQVTGKSLGEVLRDRIVEPLGLEHTTVAPPDTASPEMRGYDRSTDGALVDVTDDLVGFGNGGNGGVISTADELLRIMQSIVGGRLLPADLVTAMRTPMMNDYGLGLGTYHLTCGPFYGHEGLVNGTTSAAMVSGDGRSGAVIALNVRDQANPGLPTVIGRLVCPRLETP
jgi:D-alanyl-D-alanine carboxypeptidase